MLAPETNTRTCSECSCLESNQDDELEPFIEVEHLDIMKRIPEDKEFPQDNVVVLLCQSCYDESVCWTG